MEFHSRVIEHLSESHDLELKDYYFHLGQSSGVHVFVFSDPPDFDKGPRPERTQEIKEVVASIGDEYFEFSGGEVSVRRELATCFIFVAYTF